MNESNLISITQAKLNESLMKENAELRAQVFKLQGEVEFYRQQTRTNSHEQSSDALDDY